MIIRGAYIECFTFPVEQHICTARQLFHLAMGVFPIQGKKRTQSNHPERSGRPTGRVVQRHDGDSSFLPSEDLCRVSAIGAGCGEERKLKSAVGDGIGS